MNRSGLERSACTGRGEVLLRLKNVSKVFPGTVALRQVNLEVARGEVHGIIGKNGAGKSTLVGIIAGIITPTTGEIWVDRQRFAALSRAAAKKAGIAIVTQEPQVVLDLAVAENLFLGDYTGRGSVIRWKELYERAERILGEADFRFDVRTRAGDLSISEQQLLLVIKACYVENAQIVILDEVSASLSQDGQETLYRIIEQQKRQGRTVLFISHRTDELLQVCDRVTVLRDGESVATQDCSALDKKTLSSLIVGQGYGTQLAAEEKPSCRSADAETVLAVKDLTKAGTFHHISFEVKKGEIVGLAGLRGSGRTEILKGIAGIDPVDGGWVVIGGRRVRFSSPHQALGNGVVYLPEDREAEGLISGSSIRENLTLNALRQISRGGLIDRRKESGLVGTLVDMLQIKAASPEQEVRQLSGGNRQKVVIGRILAARPRVFLLDEPTKGIDIAAKESILNIIKNRLSESAGIVITSPGLEDLIMVCDRILVLYNGQIIAEFTRGEFDERTLYLAIQGVTEEEAGERVAR
ncbi:MAG: sugar ABC transporter ATP-binding protein [Clostridia bacterium]|nr:sugar ABC transporter ATP-binding protein [Clostridia bacterium]